MTGYQHFLQMCTNNYLLLEDCRVIFAVNSLLERTDVLINHPPTAENPHQLDLSRQFLLPSFLMFSLSFLLPCLSFTFEFRIVVANPQFVDSDYCLTMLVIRILKFLQVLHCQLEMKSHLFPCEQMRNPRGTNLSF